jgi:hypothetical protein
VTTRVLTGIALATVCLWPGPLPAAFNFDVHPGLYTSCEYTDNYEGDVRDGRGDTIYTVGPSLSLTGASPSASLDFTGRYTRTFHDRNKQDDSPEVVLSSRAAFGMDRLGLSLTYGFVRTLTRDTLSEPFGERRIQNGGVSATWAASQAATLRAGYDFVYDDWRGDTEEDEDVISNAGDLGATVWLDRRTSADLRLRCVLHDYDVSRDVIETEATSRIERALTQALTMGISLMYTSDHLRRPDDDRPRLRIRRGGLVIVVHEDMLPDDMDRIDARLTMRYALAGSWTLSAEAGAGRLDVEGEDTRNTYVGTASLEKQLEYDRFTLSGSKAYTSEFTASHYGIYDTSSAALSWERQLHKGWTSRTSLGYEKRKPVSGTEYEEEEKDTTGAVSFEWRPIEQFDLNWQPMERLTVSTSYTYLRTEYESSGTARENRYGVMAEVRF